MPNLHSTPVARLLNSLAVTCLALVLVASFIMPALPLLISLLSAAVTLFVAEAVIAAIIATRQQQIA